MSASQAHACPNAATLPSASGTRRVFTTSHSGAASLPPNSVSLAASVSREYLLYHKVCPVAINDDGALVVAVCRSRPPIHVDGACVRRARCSSGERGTAFYRSVTRRPRER